MSKLSCEVIKDLMPSYIDGICSSESKKLIEEHIADCADCNQLLERMKDVEIVSDKTNEKEIDYMKKIKRHNAYKNLIGLGLLIAFIAVGMAVIIGSYGNVPIGLYYMILPVLVFASYYMLSDHTTKMLHSKWSVGISILGLVLIAYCLYLELSVLKWIDNGTYPFGIAAYKLGPFVYHQLLAITLIQIAIFIGSLILSVKTANSYGLLLDISITGSCLALAFISLLKRTDSIETFVSARNISIITLIIESAIMAIMVYLLERKKYRS